MTPSELRIAYVNVNGLKLNTLRAACEWISSGVWDLVFLAETWFAHESTYRSSPYFVTSTTRPPRHPNSSRDTAGIILLSNTSFKPHLNVQVSTHFVTCH